MEGIESQDKLEVFGINVLATKSLHELLVVNVSRYFFFISFLEQ